MVSLRPLALSVSFFSPNWHIVACCDTSFADDSFIFHVSLGMCVLVLLCKPTFYPPM